MARMRRKWAWGGGAVAAVLVGYLACAPVPAEPVAWDPPAAPDWSSLAVTVERHLEGEGVGPEDVAVDGQGRVYTGYADGRILRWDPGAETPDVFATLSGRPLGLAFDAQGLLWVADGEGGLLSVDAEGTVRPRAVDVGGEPLVFADDVAIAPDGTVFFSEASRRWSVHDSTLDAIEAVPTGRLLAYDPATEETTVRLESLRYANGVAVTADGQAVLVVETFGYRVSRLWIDGPRRGERDVFVDALPGMPDNVHVDERGRVWVALIKERSGLLDALYPWPQVRKVLFRIPRAWLPVPPPIVWFAVFGPDGALLGSFRTEDGYGDVTSVTPDGDHLWLGSLSMPALGRAAMPLR